LSFALSLLDPDLKSLDALPSFGPPLPSAVRRTDLSGRVVDVRLQGMTTLSPTNDPFEFPSAAQFSPQQVIGCDETPERGSGVEDMEERFSVGREADEVFGCVYYQLDLSLSSGSEQQSLFVLVEIPPNYPLRTPRVLLAPRTASSAPSTHSYASLSALRSIEQEVNAGCLLFFENSSDSFLNKNELLEEALDSVLSLQMSTLVSLLATGATFDQAASVTPATDNGTPGSTICKSGNGRSALSKLYGRNYFGV
jgi:hypothetical protein